MECVLGTWDCANDGRPAEERHSSASFLHGSPVVCAVFNTTYAVSTSLSFCFSWKVEARSDKTFNKEYCCSQLFDKGACLHGSTHIYNFFFFSAIGRDAARNAEQTPAMSHNVPQCCSHGLAQLTVAVLVKSSPRLETLASATYLVRLLHAASCNLSYSSVVYVCCRQRNKQCPTEVCVCLLL